MEEGGCEKPLENRLLKLSRERDLVPSRSHDDCRGTFWLREARPSQFVGYHVIKSGISHAARGRRSSNFERESSSDRQEEPPPTASDHFHVLGSGCKPVMETHASEHEILPGSLWGSWNPVLHTCARPPSPLETNTSADMPFKNFQPSFQTTSGQTLYIEVTDTMSRREHRTTPHPHPPNPPALCFATSLAEHSNFCANTHCARCTDNPVYRSETSLDRPVARTAYWPDAYPKVRFRKPRASPSRYLSRAFGSGSRFAACMPRALKDG